MRVNELDSVRGIAAFVVVLHHCWQSLLPDQNVFPFGENFAAQSDLMWRIAYWIGASPLRLLFSGHAAVGIFFVLSGFVLAKSLETPRRPSYRQFVVRRLFRIWVPFAIVVVFAALICRTIDPQSLPNQPWLNSSWQSPVTLKLVIGHLAMWGTANYQSLDNPMWSLVHELRISIIFPALLLLVKRHPRSALAGSLLIFITFSISRLQPSLYSWVGDPSAAEFMFSLIQTARYLLFFVLGILLATNSEQIELALKHHSSMKATLWLIAAAALAVPYNKAYLELVIAFGAFLLLALCIHSEPVKHFLRHSLFTWLGKISYSLYLTHLVVILSMVHVLNGHISLVLSVTLALPLSLFVAYCVNAAIELPSNAIGKRLANTI